MLSEDLAWRRKERIDLLPDEHGADVLGCAVDDIWPWSPAWTQGFDRTGRPGKVLIDPLIFVSPAFGARFENNRQDPCGPGGPSGP